MPNEFGQMNAQQQQQQQPLFQRPTKKEALRSGLTLEQFQQMQRDQEVQEDQFFYNLLKNDEKYRELGALQTYVNGRKQNAWAQNFDECGKESEEILAQFKALYIKNHKKENWQERSGELAQLKTKAKDLTKKMAQRDQAQKAIRDDATFEAFDNEIRTLLQHTSKNDSDAYKAVAEAATEYINEPNLSKQMDILWRLQGCMMAYAQLRYKTKYGTPQGRKRMTQITKLLAMTDKLFVYREIIDIRGRDKAAHENLSNELKTYEADTFNEALTKYKKTVKTNIPDIRWSQIMLPYERDKNGNVTLETVRNYQINQKFLRAFSSNDTERQLAALARIFLRQSLPDLTQDDLDAKNILECEKKSFYGENCLNANKPLLCSFIEELRKRMDANNPLLQYMADRLRDNTMNMMSSVFAIHVQNIGLDMKNFEKCKIPAKSKEELQALEDSLLAQTKAQHDTLHVPINKELENQLRQLIQKVDQAESKEQNKPATQEYMAMLCKAQKSKSRHEKKAKALIEERYSNYLNGDNKYWENNEQLYSLLLVYNTNKDGQPTQLTQKLFDYNEKAMQLLHSDNVEDRIAALASVYLRLAKFERNNDSLESQIAAYDHNMIFAKGFSSLYQTFRRFLLQEEKRSSHPYITYMKNVFDSNHVTKILPLVNLNRLAHGYDQSAHFTNDENSEAASKAEFDTKAKEVLAEMKAEKANDPGTINMEMENTLRALCDKKGLKIFDKS